MKISFLLFVTFGASESSFVCGLHVVISLEGEGELLIADVAGDNLVVVLNVGLVEMSFNQLLACKCHLALFAA